MNAEMNPVSGHSEDGNNMSSEKLEELRQQELARQMIAQLESALSDNPKDVSMYTELMRLYRQIGADTHCERMMQKLRAISSQEEIRDAAKEFVATVDSFSNGARTDVDKLRKRFDTLFGIIESCQEIRPIDIMVATGCDCSFAIEVLKAFARLGMISKDLSLGLRKVFDCHNLRWTIVLDEDAMCQTELPPQLLKHYGKALTAVHDAGECKISVIMRKTSLGYNSSAALADYINHHADWRKDNV